jgi:ferrous iron transport protein A
VLTHLLGYVIVTVMQLTDTSPFFERTTFVGVMKRQNHGVSALAIPLGLAYPGERYRIVSLANGKGFRERLTAMGLGLGSEIMVIGQRARGAVLIAASDARLAIGAGMADKLKVRPLKQGRSGRESTRTLMQGGKRMAVSIRDLETDSKGRVVGYAQGAKNYVEKLLAMGLTKGAEFTVTRVAPLGDPVEIKLRGFNLTLRKAEADILLVERS